jgi:hypothetical protein
MIRILIPALAGLILAGCANTASDKTAGAEPRPARQCFFASTVSSFSAVDERTVHVRVGVKDVYRLDLFGRCPDVDWNQQIALVSRGGNSICSGLDATIITKGPIGPQRCPVSKVTKLTPEEVAALKAKP